MRRKLPPDAFTHYFSLGPGRSYQAVANFFQVDKKTITRRAKLENWQGKLADLERQAQEKTNQKIVSTLEEMNERHLKILRVVQARALETLRATPLKTASDAVRALEFTVRNERLILGEPVDSAELNIETIVRREYDSWLKRDPSAPDTDIGPDAAPDAPRVVAPPPIEDDDEDDED